MGASLRRVLGRATQYYLRFVWATSRITVIGAERQASEYASPTGAILAGLHGRLMILIREFQYLDNPYALVSRNTDGQAIIEVIEPFGARFLRGSSARNGKDKGGSLALREAIRVLQEDPTVYLVITPDGPRGPRGRVKVGIALMSIKSGRKVQPTGYAAWPSVMMKSWDTQLVPLPFGKITICWGIPLDPPDAPNPDSVEAYRLTIERAILDCQAQADATLKGPAFEPAPAAPEAP